MYIEEDLLKHLEADKLKNINLINFIKGYKLISLDKVHSSVMVRAKSDRTWVYFSSSDEEEYKRLLKQLNTKDKCFSAIEDWMVSYLTENRKIKWQLSCKKLYFPDNIIIPVTTPKVVVLSEDMAEYVYNNYEYKELITLDYTKERIKNGIALGIYEDGLLVAFIITQDDGAIGFLTVLEAYRSKGYAKELSIAMINKLRELNTIPFIHIEENNVKSMRLSEKLGFLEYSNINWLEFE